MMKACARVSYPYSKACAQKDQPYMSAPKLQQRLCILPAFFLLPGNSEQLEEGKHRLILGILDFISSFLLTRLTC